MSAVCPICNKARNSADKGIVENLTQKLLFYTFRLPPLLMNKLEIPELRSGSTLWGISTKAVTLIMLPVLIANISC